MTDILDDVFDQAQFSSSAAALVASHAMSDAVWRAYLSKLPAKQPQLRMVLVILHRQALVAKPFNLTDARKTVADHFDVEIGTAKSWIEQLEKLGFLVRLQGDKKNAFQIVPSREAKVALLRVGQEYLVCLRLVYTQLRNAMRNTGVNVSDLGWLEDIKALLEIDVKDYPTKPAK